MSAAKYYIRIDTYWQNSRDTFFGPYPTREAAATALTDSGVGRSDLGQAAHDIKNQTRCLGILNTTQARQNGMNNRNTIPAQNTIPGDLYELAELENIYLIY